MTTTLHHANIYAHPQYYEIAFHQPEVRQQARFFDKAYHHHASTPLKRVLELGCGPGLHLRYLAKSERQLTGLDASSAMIEHATRQFSKQGISAEFVLGRFEQPTESFASGTLFDLITMPSGNPAYLLTIDDLIAHLREVYTLLAPGGVYIMDCHHPIGVLRGNTLSDTFGYGRKGKISVSYCWKYSQAVIDYKHETETVEAQFTVRSGDTVTEFRDWGTQKMWVYSSIIASFRVVEGFRIAGEYGTYQLSVPFDGHAREDRMIFVACKD